MTDTTDISRLNGICPYFTMFPLNFPLSILSELAEPGDWVLDPFCGRGTTLFAARILNLPSIGVDTSPVATALTEAKLVNTTPARILQSASRILESIPHADEIPEGEFWDMAYSPDVLDTLCRLREGLLKNCRSAARKALRAIILGGLHGPLGKSRQSYFSNQCQRTYAPKPDYAIRYWRERNLAPPSVSILEIIKHRAERYYSAIPPSVTGRVACKDSRVTRSICVLTREARVRWIITSPPYYGLRTYIPDQWLRMWFLGGKPYVDYSPQKQIEHRSAAEFAVDLHKVWKNMDAVAADDATLVVRFGSINSRKVDAVSITQESLRDTGWRVQAIKPAGSALHGRRQALHFSGLKSPALEEYDIWAVR